MEEEVNVKRENWLAFKEKMGNVDMNPYLSAVGSGIAIAQDWMNANTQLSEYEDSLDMDFEFGGSTTDEYGRPTYNMGDKVGQFKQFDPRDYDSDYVGKNLGFKGVMQGAMGGSAFGPIGAVAGGVTGLIGGALKRRSLQRKADQAQRRAIAQKGEDYREMMSTQGEFNEKLQSYDAREDAIAQYRAQMQKRRENLMRLQ